MNEKKENDKSPYFNINQLKAFVKMKKLRRRVIMAPDALEAPKKRQRAM